MKCYSRDEENFNYESLGELLDNFGDDICIGDVVYEGDAVKPLAGSLITAKDIIETMGERAYDIVGEVADDYPDVDIDARTELDKLLSEWVEKYCPPTFWSVRNVVEITITKEHLECN